MILLRKFKFRESDLMIHAINLHGEKLHLLARGALRSKKRFAGGVLEPTHYVLAHYKKPVKATENIHHLQEATLLDDFTALKADYDRLQLAFHLVKRIDQMSQEGEQEDANLFHLLGNALKVAGQTQSLEVLRLQFECKLLNYQGVLEPSDTMVPLLKENLNSCDQIELSDAQKNEVQRHLRRTFESYTQNSFER